VEQSTRRASVLVNDEQHDVPVDLDDVVAIVEHTMRALSVPPEAAVSVTLVDAASIADLKQQAFGVHRATDVLSFPMDDLDDPMPGPLVLGDVVVCPQVAARQARALGIPLEQELRHLVVHGLLHLTGRDHGSPQDELDMARAEHDILASASR